MEAHVSISTEETNARYVMDDTDHDLTHRLIQWCYDNATERFVFVPPYKIYFESEDDAIAFKLAFV